MKCERHGLGCGPDGLCVLCRKSKPPEPGIGRPVVLAVAATALALAGIGAVIVARPRATGAIEADFHSVAEPPVVPSSDEPVPAPVVHTAAEPVAPPAAVNAARVRELDTLRAMASGSPSGTSDPASPGPSPSTAAMAAPAPVEPPPPPPPQPAPAAIPSDVHVVVYTTTWCPVCKRAKAWMNANGVAYEERDVEASDTNAHRMRVINPRGGVPTFDVEGQVVVGFSEDSLLATMRQASQRRSAGRPL